MFQRLDGVLYIWGHLFIVYVTFIRLIVLYSRCRVNRSTNLSVVLYYVICFCFASTVHLGFHVAFPTCGVRLHNGGVHFTSFGFEAGNSASVQPPPPNVALFEPLPGLAAGRVRHADMRPCAAQRSAQARQRPRRGEEERSKDGGNGSSGPRQRLVQ